MLKRISMVLTAGALMVPLAACDFSATAKVDCRTVVGGNVVCEGESTMIPPTPPVPPTTPPTSEPTPQPTTPPPTTTPAPPTTTEPPPPTTTTPPPAANTAAERFGWGQPDSGDEFNGTSLNRALWGVYDSPGHDNNGRRTPAAITVADGVMTMTGSANGDTGGMAWEDGQRYGRWEARVRSYATASSGNPYHPVLIIWPDSNRWPHDGEYDFLENSAPGEACAETFMHYPHPNMPVQQEFKRETNCGAPLSEWHNVAVEWTPNHIKGFIDGKEWFSFAGGAGPGGRKAIQDMPSGHLTVQLDNFHGSGMQPAKFEIDWVKIYKL